MPDKVLLVDLYALPQYDLSLALGCLKANAEADPDVRAAFEIHLLHMSEQTPTDEVVKAVVAAGARVVGFSCYSWNIRAVERALAKLPAAGRPFVVLGGVEVTPSPGLNLKRRPNADAVVFGEGEETFRELLTKTRDGETRFGPAHLRRIKGLAWREGAEIRVNPARPPVEDLAQFPSPYLSGTYGDLLKGRGRVMVETARGCHYHCTFCFEPRGFARVRTLPLDRVKKELAFIVGAGVREVMFLDTNFNSLRKRAVEILEFLAELGGRVRYAFEFRGELLDADQARAISKIDYYVEIGLQTVNEKALAAVKRGYQAQKFGEGIRQLLEAGIYRPCSYGEGGVTIDLMAGLPHETVADVHHSFDFVLSLAPTKIELSMTKLLPGTELYDDAPKFGYEFDLDAQYQVLSTQTMTRDDVRGLNRFREAVEFTYNTVHAVRTIAWTARETRTKPAAVVVYVAEQVGAAKKDYAELTVNDLGEMLANYCTSNGAADAAKAVQGKLTSEALLNVLQKRREARRSWFSNLVFRMGYRFLKTFGGLAPLPEPMTASSEVEEPTGGMPGELPPAQLVQIGGARGGASSH